MYPSGSHTGLMQRLDAATVEVPEQAQSGIFTTQLLLHLTRSSCITASFSSAARRGLVPVQIAAMGSRVAGSSVTPALTAFSGLPAPSSPLRLSMLKSLPEAWARRQPAAPSLCCPGLLSPSFSPTPVGTPRWKLFAQRDRQNQNSWPTADQWFQAGVSLWAVRCRPGWGWRGCLPRSGYSG